MKKSFLLFLLPLSCFGQNVTAPATLKRIVFEGDSITAGEQYGGKGYTYAPYVASNLNLQAGRYIDCIFWAQSGKTLSAIVSQDFNPSDIYRHYVIPFQPVNPGDVVYFFLWAGRNDLALAHASAASIEANLTTAWANLRSAGFKVVAFTMAPGADITGADETSRVAVNSWIVANSSLYDFGPVRPDVYFPMPADTSIFFDGVHLTNAAASTLATRVLGLISLPTGVCAGLNNGNYPCYTPVLAAGYLSAGRSAQTQYPFWTRVAPNANLTIQNHLGDVRLLGGSDTYARYEPVEFDGSVLTLNSNGSGLLRVDQSIPSGIFFNAVPDGQLQVTHTAVSSH